jgi:phage-related protein
MKKSNKTPQREIDTARRRLEEARKEPERYESE